MINPTSPDAGAFETAMAASRGADHGGQVRTTASHDAREHVVRSCETTLLESPRGGRLATTKESSSSALGFDTGIEDEEEDEEDDLLADDWGVRVKATVKHLVSVGASKALPELARASFRVGVYTAICLAVLAPRYHRGGTDHGPEGKRLQTHQTQWAAARCAAGNVVGVVFAAVVRRLASSDFMQARATLIVLVLSAFERIPLDALCGAAGLVAWPRAAVALGVGVRIGGTKLHNAVLDRLERFLVTVVVWATTYGVQSLYVRWTLRRWTAEKFSEKVTAAVAARRVVRAVAAVAETEQLRLADAAARRKAGARIATALGRVALQRSRSSQATQRKIRGHSDDDDVDDRRRRPRGGEAEEHCNLRERDTSSSSGRRTEHQRGDDDSVALDVSLGQQEALPSTPPFESQANDDWSGGFVGSFERAARKLRVVLYLGAFGDLSTTVESKKIGKRIFRLLRSAAAQRRKDDDDDTPTKRPGGQLDREELRRLVFGGPNGPLAPGGRGLFSLPGIQGGDDDITIKMPSRRRPRPPSNSKQATTSPPPPPPPPLQKKTPGGGKRSPGGAAAASSQSRKQTKGKQQQQQLKGDASNSRAFDELFPTSLTAIREEDVVEPLLRVYRERSFLSATIQSFGTINQLVVKVGLVTWCVFAAVFLFIYWHVPLTDAILAVGTLSLALSFAVGSSAANLVSGMAFILLSAPYDIGDRVVVASIGSAPDTFPMYVEEISAYSTTFRTSFGEIVIMANYLVASRQLVNHGRSTKPWLMCTVKLSTRSRPDQVARLAGAVKRYAREHPDDWYGIDLWFSRFDHDAGALVLDLWCGAVIPYQEFEALYASRSRLYLFIHAYVHHAGLHFVGPILPVYHVPDSAVPATFFATTTPDDDGQPADPPAINLIDFAATATTTNTQQTTRRRRPADNQRTF